MLIHEDRVYLAGKILISNFYMNIFLQIDLINDFPKLILKYSFMTSIISIFTVY